MGSSLLRLSWHRTLSRTAVVAVGEFFRHCHRTLRPNCRALVGVLLPGWADSDSPRRDRRIFPSGCRTLPVRLGLPSLRPFLACNKTLLQPLANAIMPRTNRLSGYGGIFHLTHPCHNRDFLLIFGVDRNMTNQNPSWKKLQRLVIVKDGCPPRPYSTSEVIGRLEPRSMICHKGARMKATKLNIGCGNKRKEGFIGIDRFKTDATDIVLDIESQPLPFPDSSVQEVLMDNLIEHIMDIPAVMKEIHRVGVAGASVTVITPHFAGIGSWRDPTHVHHLSYFSMDHFEKQGACHYTGGGFKVLERRLSFGGLLGGMGRLIFLISPRHYEANWCFIFRPSTLRFILKVVK